MHLRGDPGRQGYFHDGSECYDFDPLVSKRCRSMNVQGDWGLPTIHLAANTQE